MSLFPATNWEKPYEQLLRAGGRNKSQNNKQEVASTIETMRFPRITEYIFFIFLTCGLHAYSEYHIYKHCKKTGVLKKKK